MDIREDAARFYDLQNNPTSDIPFYRERLSSEVRILELGCGTGRVLLPLAPHCGFIYGIDSSAAMLSICREKLEHADLPTDRAELKLGDITDFDLGQTFDLITAPFRVLQNLETDVQVEGLLRCIHRHLAPNGTAILNAFHPYRPKEVLLQEWCSPDENFEGEIELPDGRRMARLDRRPRLQLEPLVLYPELIYRLYGATGELEEETVLPIAMRCWYPDEFANLITQHGFEIVAQWGGYQGEKWAEGSELVIQFQEAGRTSPVAEGMLTP